MTLAQLRRYALNKFGILAWEEEHPILNFGLVKDAINDAHRWFAHRTRCYYDNDRTEAVTSGAGARYALDSDIFLVNPASVRINVGGTYTQLTHRRLGSIVADSGPLEGIAAATPTFFLLEMGGESNDEPVAIRLVPAPNGNATLYYGGWHYGAELSAETDRPKLPEAEHHRLLPAICWRLAEALNQAGEAADPAYWKAEAERMADEWSLNARGSGDHAARTLAREGRMSPREVAR